MNRTQRWVSRGVALMVFVGLFVALWVVYVAELALWSVRRLSSTGERNGRR